MRVIVAPHGNTTLGMSPVTSYGARGPTTHFPRAALPAVDRPGPAARDRPDTVPRRECAYPVIDDQPAFWRLDWLGESPILPASHHAPSRASSSTCGRPSSSSQAKTTTTYWLSPRGLGHGTMDERPAATELARKNAASLSSGDMIAPWRSNVWKSSVIASATNGPAREYAVRSRRSARDREKDDARSSTPQNSSGYWSARGPTWVEDRCASR